MPDGSLAAGPSLTHRNNGKEGCAGRRVHYFNITYACNSRCSFCAADIAAKWRADATASMPLARFEAALDELSVNERDQVILNGGEPTMHPEFVGFLRAIASRGAKRTVFTNGRRLCEESLARKIALCGPVELLIPIYSPDSARHDACTGVPGSLAQTLDGLRMIVDLQRCGFKLPVEIRLLLSRQTAPLAADVVRFLSKEFKEGDFYFSLNPLIVSRQALDGGHAQPLSGYGQVVSEVVRECASSGRVLVTKSLPRCLIWTVFPEQALSTVFLEERTGSHETYSDPYQEKPYDEGDQREFAQFCGGCILRAACPGFPVGHVAVFGNMDAHAVSRSDVVDGTVALLLPMLKQEDMIDIAGCRRVQLPDKAICLVEPISGSWYVPEGIGTARLSTQDGPWTVSALRETLHDVSGQMIGRLLLSGIGRLNGRSLVPGLRTAGDGLKPSIGALVVKYTRDCNLQCAYCYARGCTRSSGRALPNEAILRALKLLQPILAEPCDLIIHGGEPLLRAAELGELMCRLREDSEGRLNVSIQTNATLITEDVARVLKNHSVGVGVSVDGATLSENSYRCYADGSASLRATLEGLKNLLRTGVKPGLILVLHSKNQQSILDSLKAYESFGITDFVVNPLFPGGAAQTLGPSASASTEATVESLRRLLLWINDQNRERSGDSRLYERNLSTLVRHLTTYQRRYMCARIPCGAGVNTLSIDADGSIYPCDDFMSAPEFRLGSIADIEDPTSFVTGSAIVKQLHGRSVDQCAQCRECCWQAICPSHCAAESYFSGTDLHHPGVLCHVMRKFIPTVIGLISSGRIDPQLVVRVEAPVRQRD